MRRFAPLPFLHGLALLALFVLPWMTVSCPRQSPTEGANTQDISGWELALVPGSIPKPQPPGGWPAPTHPKPKRDRLFLHAEHPSYLLVPGAAFLVGLLAFRRLRASRPFQRAALLGWVLACLALGQGTLRDAWLFRGDPWGFQLHWRLPF